MSVSTMVDDAVKSIDEAFDVDGEIRPILLPVTLQSKSKSFASYPVVITFSLKSICTVIPLA